MADKLQVLGAGSEGLEEMQPLLDDGFVQWALLRFDVGQGTLKRQKILFLIINGEECPPLLRGRLNALTPEVQVMFGKDGIHATLEVKRREDATLEHVAGELGKFFVTDSGDYDVQAYIRDLQKSAPPIASPRLSTSAPAEGAAAEKVHKFSRLFTSGRKALKAVAEPMGPWNWIFVGPNAEDLPLIGGGNGSVDEMSECLSMHQAEVMYGLLRLGFGEGRLRRTKHVFVHAVGPEASAVTRAKHNALKPQLEKIMRSHAMCSVALEVATVEDLTLADIIARVRKAGIVDDEVLAGDAPESSIFSEESFRKALAEEQKASETVDENQPYIPGSSYTVEEAVKLIHSPGGLLNWALFVPGDSWKQKKGGGRASMAPGRNQLVPPGGARERQSSQPPPLRVSLRTARPLDGEDRDDGGAMGRRKSSVRAGSVPAARSSERLRLGSQSLDEALLNDLPQDPPAEEPAPAKAAEEPAPAKAAEEPAPAKAAEEPAPAKAAEEPVPAKAAEEPAPAKEEVKDAPPVVDEPPPSVPEPAHPAVEVVKDTPPPSPAPAAIQTPAKEDPPPKAAAPEAVKAVDVPAQIRQSMMPDSIRLAGPLLKLSGSFMGGWQLRWCEVALGAIQWWDKPEHAKAGQPPNGGLELKGLKVSMQFNSSSVFILHAENEKGKDYFLDANIGTAVKKAGWDVVARIVALSASDWVRALEHEAVLRRRVE